MKPPYVSVYFKYTLLIFCSVKKLMRNFLAFKIKYALILLGISCHIYKLHSQSH